MNARPEHLIDVGDVEQIPREGARRVQAGDKQIAIFRTRDSELFALADQCPHEAGPLSQGIVHGDCVTCPLHNWVISLRSGQAQGADDGSVVRYPVTVQDSRIMLSLQPASS